MQREVIEIKVKRDRMSWDSLLQDGLTQTLAYMDRCGATHGHLVVFDTNTDEPWSRRIFERTLADRVSLWGC